jgi:flagellin-like hook-associated protein FlgL
MAEAMSEFVKYQILLQAGVAMLAQGNQLPQVVLSLFQ